MTQDEANSTMVQQFVNEYAVLDGWPFETDRKALLSKMLVETYFSACKDLESATEVHAAVMRNEERVPKPATIRKWLRELDHVELDASEHIGR